MSEDSTQTSEKAAADVPEALIKAALTQGIAGLMSPGLALAVQAVRKARAEGLAVYITLAFNPDGSIQVLEPHVERPEPDQVEETQGAAEAVAEPEHPASDQAAVADEPAATAPIQSPAEEPQPEVGSAAVEEPAP